MGRPRLAETEIRENFTVRLSPAERAAVEERARLLTMTPSDYARACLVQGTVKVIREEGHDPEKGVDQAVVSPAAISITAGRAGCSYRDRTDHTG